MRNPSDTIVAAMSVVAMCNPTTTSANETPPTIAGDGIKDSAGCVNSCQLIAAAPTPTRTKHKEDTNRINIDDMTP